MQQDEFFPLDAVPPRVRRALLREFQGRRPTVQEVSQISDRHWLATPDIGPSTLEKIHSILCPQLRQGDSAPPRLTDTELLILEARIGASSRKRHKTGVSTETLSQV
jgi:hypothetical protein